MPPREIPKAARGCSLHFCTVGRSDGSALGGDVSSHLPAVRHAQACSRFDSTFDTASPGMVTLPLLSTGVGCSYVRFLTVCPSF